MSSAGHLLFHGGLTLGMLAGGALAQTIGIRQTMLIGSFGYLLSTLWLTVSPIRHVRKLPAASGSQDSFAAPGNPNP